MLQMPRRSVTRFFIPLIDVLTLLFCIFLMMPVVKKGSEAEAADAARADLLDERERQLAERERKADAKERELRQELDRLRKETAKEVLKQLATRVLEIDPSNGKLYYRNPDRVEVHDEADARALIRRDRDGPGGPHEVYYVILYPRDPNSEYPLKSQREQYEHWFADVPVKYDRPFAGAEEGETAVNVFTYFAAMVTTELPKQILMIVGGAAVGAFGSGLIAQLTTRSLTTKKLPPLPTTVIRGLGGVALGVLTAMWVWQGGGGWGLGGGNGNGVSAGNGNGETKTEADKAPAKAAEDVRDKDKVSPDETNPPSPESVLRLEVLTDDAVRKLDGQQAVSEHRYYRLEDKDAKDLQTLADLKQTIEKRVGDKPPLQRLDVVTRADSPDKSAARVEQVRQLASDFRLKVEFPPR